MRRLPPPWFHPIPCARVRAAPLFERAVLRGVHRFQPLRRGVLAGNFNGQVGKPAVLCRAVPVLYLSRNVDAVAWIHLNCRLALLLIVSASTDTYKDLSATALCVMDVPVYGSPAQMSR